MKRIITTTIISLLILGLGRLWASEDKNSIRATIYAWQEAWQSKDINRYKLFYSKTFKSDGFDYQGWMNKKKRIFAVPGAISIELFDLEIDTQDGKAIATFIQRYKSPTLADDGEKTLVLIQSDGMYKIISEQFKPLETPSPSEVEALFDIEPTSKEREATTPPTPTPTALPTPIAKPTASPTPATKHHVADGSIRLDKLTHTSSIATVIGVISKKDEWRQIQWADGQKGWLNDRLIPDNALTNLQKEAIPASKAPVSQTSGTERTVISNTNLEWLYQAPSKDSKKLVRLTKGKKYVAVKFQSDWVGLQLEPDMIGWTDQKYLQSEVGKEPVAVKTLDPPTPKPTVSVPPQKSIQPSESGQAQKETITTTQTVKLVTPKVSFARAYEKPTIDSMILFRLKQDKRYILLGTKGDWLHIQDDTGHTGWGHRTLFEKKIETATIPVTIVREKEDEYVPQADDLPPGTLPSDSSAQAKEGPSSMPDPDDSDKAADEQGPLEDDSAKQITPSQVSEDEPPLFPEDDAFEQDDELAMVMEEKPTMNQMDTPKAGKTLEPEDSIDENAVQLEIKGSNQLTPTVSLVRVYSKPSTDARIMFWLTKGKTYTFTDKKDGWYHIRLADGRTGWTHLALHMDDGRVRVREKNKNETISIDKQLTSVVILGGAHEKPALDSKVVFRLVKGETYKAEKKQGSWFLIKDKNGDAGWAHKSLFETSEPKPKEAAVKSKQVNEIRFETTTSGEEKVLFSLSGFYPPEVFLTEESQSTLICDFSEISTLNNLKPVIGVNQKFIKQIRTEMNKGALRVSIDLIPGKSYDVRQVFFKKENLFTLIFSADES